MSLMLVLVVIQNTGRNTIYIYGRGSFNYLGQVFAQIKVQKSGLCHEYKVRNLIENGLHVNDTNVYVWHMHS